jgi:tetratricopeptide (TPR) repeat protein
VVLAQSLDSLGNVCWWLGRVDEALGAAGRGLEIRERLAKQNADVFEPDLADSLNNLGSVYWWLGSLEGAHGAAERALEILVRLAKQNPDAFEPRLAAGLQAIGIIVQEGNPARAANAFRRGVETLRRLFLLHPNDFARQMAALKQGYLRSCRSSGQEPDLDLLAPIAEALQSTTRTAM